MLKLDPHPSLDALPVDVAVRACAATGCHVLVLIVFLADVAKPAEEFQGLALMVERLVVDEPPVGHFVILTLQILSGHGQTITCCSVMNFSTILQPKNSSSTEKKIRKTIRICFQGRLEVGLDQEQLFLSRSAQMPRVTTESTSPKKSSPKRKFLRQILRLMVGYSEHLRARWQVARQFQEHFQQVRKCQALPQISSERAILVSRQALRQSECAWQSLSLQLQTGKSGRALVASEQQILHLKLGGREWLVTTMIWESLSERWVWLSTVSIEQYYQPAAYYSFKTKTIVSEYQVLPALCQRQQRQNRENGNDS